MTKQESILISAFTGYLLTPEFSDMHEFIEKTMGRPVQTYEMGDKGFMDKVRKKLKHQIIEMINDTNDS